jgi:hypothetical protein
VTTVCVDLNLENNRMENPYDLVVFHNLTAPEARTVIRKYFCES